MLGGDLVEDEAELLKLVRADVRGAVGVGSLQGLDQGLGVPVQEVHGQAVLRPVPDAQRRGPGRVRVVLLVRGGAEPGGRGVRRGGGRSEAREGGRTGRRIGAAWPCRCRPWSPAAAPSAPESARAPSAQSGRGRHGRAGGGRTETMISLPAGSPRRIMVSKRSGAKSGSLRQWPATSRQPSLQFYERGLDVPPQDNGPESAARISGRQKWEFDDVPA